VDAWVVTMCLDSCFLPEQQCEGQLDSTTSEFKCICNAMTHCSVDYAGTNAADCTNHALTAVPTCLNAYTDGEITYVWTRV
jgi:hypothetical protein